MQRMSHTHISEQDQTLMRIATIASMAMATTLIVLKAIAWFMTGSVSMLSSVMDSAMDVAISFMNFMAVRYALVPPDDEHRFGHYGAEDVSALFQAAFVAGSGLLIIIESIDRFFTPVVVDHSTVGIAVMILSLASTLVLVAFQKRVHKKTGSTAIRADSMHYVSDVVQNIGVIIAIIASGVMGWHFLDPIIAIIIACYMLYGGYEIGRAALDHLLDREFPKNEREMVEKILSAHTGIAGYHGFKTRRSGVQSYIQCHLEIPQEVTLQAAKQIDRELKASIKEKIPGAEIIFQYDPVTPE